VISRLPVAQAEAELRATEALHHALSRDRARFENAIAVLLGKAPSEISLVVNPLEEAPPEIPSLVPSVLLVSRPDIRRAERQMAAANARVGVATAAFYPQVTLSADVGYASGSLSDLFDVRSFTWGVFPNIHIPVFEGGRNVAELDRARARYAEVYALYRQAVVQAFGEVEDALVSAALLEKQQTANQQAVESADEAYRLSRKQFEGGLVNYLSVLDSERTLLDNLRLSSQLRGQRYLSAVALVKSIGGTWEPRTAPVQ
jgi:multidrug efflux system outer membrane protein